MLEIIYFLIQMDVSVIIPTCKPGSYIFDCFTSVVNQDFPKDSFEVIIILNGQLEPYMSDIKSYFGSNEISYKLLYTPYSGVSNARNIALDNLNSKNIVFLDDDDLLSSNYISGLYSGISNDTVVVSNVKTFISDIKSTGDDYISRSFNKFYKHNKYSIFKYRGFMSSVCAKMIPQEIVNGFRFDPHLKIGEDAAFMFAISSNIIKLKLAEKDVIYYRRLRPDSASRISLNFFVRIRILFQSLIKYSAIYFSGFRNYNMSFYISRLLAALKFFLLSLFH